VVFRATSRSGEVVAAKRVSKSDMPPEKHEALQREVEIMHSMSDHPNVLKLMVRPLT
jgi:serine/threonine protein kinase